MSKEKGRRVTTKVWQRNNNKWPVRETNSAEEPDFSGKPATGWDGKDKSEKGQLR